MGKPSSWMAATPSLPEAIYDLCGDLVSPPWKIVKLAGDASYRVFFRLKGKDLSVVVVQYPLNRREAFFHDLPILKAFGEIQCSPTVLKAFFPFMVLQDLGTDALDAYWKNRWKSLLPNLFSRWQRMQSLSSPNEAFSKEYFLRELHLTEKHYFQLLKGKTPSPMRQRLYQAVVERLDTFPKALLHRDFHANNLLVYQGKVWFVDVQDFRQGPRFYDAVSLFWERRALLDLSIEEQWWGLRAFVERVFHLSFSQEIKEELLWTSLQRTLKVLGTFARLYAKKKIYQDYLQASERHLQTLLNQINLPWLSLQTL